MSKITPAGRSRNTWSDWQKPNDIRQSDIASSPGVYELAVFRKGQMASLYQPITQNDRLLAAQPEFQGVVYVGKAICLSERYRLMVQSWISPQSPAKHGSRKNYNADHNGSKSQFHPDEVRCRCKPLASVNWIDFRSKLKAGMSAGASWKEKLNALWPDSGQGTFANSAVATFSEEGNLLKKFEKVYGQKPLLNKRGPENLGNRPTDDELEKWFRYEAEQLDRIPDEGDIRQKAFGLWLGRSCPHGDDWTDWFAAELALWEAAILED